MGKKAIKGKEESLLILFNDCATLVDLLNVKDSIFYMQIIPYISLFYISWQKITNIEQGDGLYKTMKNIRNRIEIFREKYNKIEKRIIEEEYLQDQFFKREVNIILRHLKLYYNYGLFFVEDKKLIGNTFLSDIELDMHQKSLNEKQKLAFDIGELSGRFLNSIYQEINKTFSFIDTVDIENRKKIKYYDLNTKRNGFFNKKISKEMNIYLLFALSKLNFVKYYLEPLFVKDDLWLRRVQYISIHFSHLALKNVYKKVMNSGNEIDINICNIIKDKEKLFCTKYRNYMMHYGFIKDGCFIISDKNYDKKEPLFGLVEECFNKSYESYYNELLSYRDDIEDLLESLFDWNNIKL